MLSIDRLLFPGSAFKIDVGTRFSLLPYSNDIFYVFRKNHLVKVVNVKAFIFSAHEKYL